MAGASRGRSGQPRRPVSLAAEVGQGGEAGRRDSPTRWRRPLAVPADGGPHKTLVASFDADAVLDYLTVPVLAPEAYLRATVTNGTLLLLPGRARVFHGAQFVGETHLDTVAPGEAVRGPARRGRPDPGRAQAGPPLGEQGGARRHPDDRHRLRNHLGEPSRQPAKVSVHDHIPLSRDGEIKVKAREASPAPAKADDLGELTWELTLDDGKSATIKHRFTVEHPAQIARYRPVTRALSVTRKRTGSHAPTGG